MENTTAKAPGKHATLRPVLFQGGHDTLLIGEIMKSQQHCRLPTVQGSSVPLCHTVFKAVR
jgi:hypothetical protein